MLAYIIRRVLYVIPVVLGVALVTFILFNVVGWDAASQMLGRHASKEEILALQKQLGLAGPKWLNFEAARHGSWLNLFDSQWFFYLKQIFTFDFGRSFASNQKISTLVFNGMLPSLVLAVWSAWKLLLGVASVVAVVPACLADSAATCGVAAAGSFVCEGWATGASAFGAGLSGAATTAGRVISHS